LPTTLVAAFRATLEEVVEADVILHVRDIAAEQTEAQKRDVDSVLEELGVDPSPGAGRVIEVWNKADLLSPEDRATLANQARRREAAPVLISATAGQGISDLLERLAAQFAGATGADDERAAAAK
jgi:GTP-binding protein HflX